MAPKNSSFKIILGSSSFARRKILAEMGYEFTVMIADIDEQSIRKEKAEELVVALAEAKADAIIERLKSTGEMKEILGPTLLITADTVAVYEGVIREKPSGKEEARMFIKGYSGGQASVVGSVVVTNLTTGKRKTGWELSEKMDALLTEVLVLSFHDQMFPCLLHELSFYVLLHGCRSVILDFRNFTTLLHLEDERLPHIYNCRSISTRYQMR
ncbi:7-methyl-GTP pyrophosphatase-like isoform X1 [Ipomoea triloba]|uniref:7-methyl-GTP pyrophosphatase-like isoform X1 n=1 Tax=Ipomoea triloba TaxID=35885 RepID=UPI00125D2929|nr:7-methyl-GTP pyrophosphatase-like isoform X1 [Ipomoea triloba]